MGVCDSGKIETLTTERACKIIFDIINPPYFVSSHFVLWSKSFDKYMGYVHLDGWVLPIMANKGITFKTFGIYNLAVKISFSPTL